MTKKQFFLPAFLIVSMINTISAVQSQAFKMNTHSPLFKQSLPLNSSQFDKTVILATSNHRFDYMGKLNDVDIKGVEEVSKVLLPKLSDIHALDSIAFSLKMIELSLNKETREAAYKALELMKNPLNIELFKSQRHNKSEIPCVLCSSFGTHKGHSYDAIIFDTDDVHECEILAQSVKNLSEEEKANILKE